MQRFVDKVRTLRGALICSIVFVLVTFGCGEKITEPEISEAATYRVPGQFATIQAAMDSAVAGDVILVAPGTYSDCTHKTDYLPELHCVIMKSGVSLVSEAGPASTIIDAQGLGRVILADSCGQGTRIEGFTLTGGKTNNPYYGAGLRTTASVVEYVNLAISNNQTGGNGGGVYVWRGADHFQHCTIVSNSASTYYGGGLYCITSNATFDDCTFTDNRASRGAGIVCDFDGGATFTRCLIARNTASYSGGGIWVSNRAKVAFNFCTISDNTSSQGASFYDNYSYSVVASFYSSILAFGNGPAMSCGSTNTFECCNIYGHTGGDERCGIDRGGNFSQDPLFTDRTAGHYDLMDNSPCRPGNHPSGCNDVTIGAFPNSADPVERTTWGAIKALYRP